MSVRYSPAYLVATVVRAAALGLWGLYVAAVLSISAYGEYGLLATTVLVTAQVGLLGTAQTFVANAGRDLPTLGLLVHAGLVSLAAAAVAALLMPDQIGTARYPLVAAAALAAVAYKVLGARARARLAFGTSLAAELAVGTVLACAGLGLYVLARDCSRMCPSGPLGVVGEAFALSAAAAVLVMTPSTRLCRPEVTLRGTSRFLSSVYSAGALIVLDALLFRRVEVFFLQRSPDGTQGVAVLTLGVQFGTLLLLVPLALLDAWQPQFAMLWSQDRRRFTITFGQIERRYLLLTSAIFALGVAATAAAVALLFRKYTQWVWLVTAIAGSRVLFATAALYSATLYALSRQRVLYWPVGVGAVIALVANATLTLSHGVPGALAAYACTHGAICILAWRAFRHSVTAESSSPTPKEGDGEVPGM